MHHTGEDELIRILRGQDSIIQEVYSILEEEEKKDEVLRAVVLSSKNHCANRIGGADPARIHSKDAIRRVCVKYRLRFLPAGRYKGALPTEALHAIRRTEARSGIPLGGFMILAPAKQFTLCDCDADPLLFVPMDDGRYYLLHRWGRDMRAMRAVLGWPVRGWMHLTATVLLVSMVLAAVIPTHLLTTVPDAPWLNIHRFGALICFNLFLNAATSFGWFAFFGQFSKDAWNGPTFN